MKHHANPRFWRSYQGLPKEIRVLADRNYALLMSDPTHRSLHFKKVDDGLSLWSVRVDRQLRAVGQWRGDTIRWIWIGRHADYDRLLASV